MNDFASILPNASTRIQKSADGGELGRGMTPKSTGGVGRDGIGVGRKRSEKAHHRERQDSLRRVKDSTDMLRERSLHRQPTKNGAGLDGNSGGREGRQFTVGNVGVNGMMYLR